MRADISLVSGTRTWIRPARIESRHWIRRVSSPAAYSRKRNGSSVANRCGRARMSAAAAWLRGGSTISSGTNAGSTLSSAVATLATVTRVSPRTSWYAMRAGPSRWSPRGVARIRPATVTVSRPSPGPTAYRDSVRSRARLSSSIRSTNPGGTGIRRRTNCSSAASPWRTTAGAICRVIDDPLRPIPRSNERTRKVEMNEVAPSTR